MVQAGFHCHVFIVRSFEIGGTLLLCAWSSSSRLSQSSLSRDFLSAGCLRWLRCTKCLALSRTNLSVFLDSVGCHRRRRLRDTSRRTGMCCLRHDTKRAFAVAVFGGALACRTLLTQMNDKAEKQRLLAQVYYWLSSDPDECEVLFAFQ